MNEIAHATVCFSRAWREALYGVSAYWVNPKQSPLKTWGTSSNDTHIMNMAFEGSSGDYNTGYYNDVVINLKKATDSIRTSISTAEKEAKVINNKSFSKKSQTYRYNKR